MPAGRVGLFSSSATGNWFDDFKVRSLAADCVVDGRFTDDVGNVQVSSGKLKFLTGDSQPRQCVLRHVRMSEGAVQANLRFRAGMSAGIVLNYQDPANYGLIKLMSDDIYATLSYCEIIDGYEHLRQVQAGDPVELYDDSDFILRCCTTRSGNDLTLNVYLPDVSANPILANVDVDLTWSGGHVGLWGVPPGENDLLWDDFKCGIDNTPTDGFWLYVAADYIYADYNFGIFGTGWNTLTFSYDDNGNLTNDGLYKYKYDVWNRLVGAWYAGGDMTEANERLATYEYDGLFRRIEKIVANQGTGVVNGSDAGDITGIQAGNRHEHYYYSGWRLVEMRDNLGHALGQFAYGTQYIDEPVRYDRNTDVGGNGDSGCLDAGSKAYFYHQDANYRVVMLTSEDGVVLERYRYSAYGQPIILAGYDSTAGGESGRIALVSAVGNSFLPLGLFRDAESGMCEARLRSLGTSTGRFVSRDPLAFLGVRFHTEKNYPNGMNQYEALISNPVRWLDPQGTTILVCNRKAKGIIGKAGGNHAYIWDTTTETSCGMDGSSGSRVSAHGGDNSTPGSGEKGPAGPNKAEGDCCKAVPDSDGKEGQVMSDCRSTANKWFWYPLVNDCHSVVYGCLERSGLKPVEPPGGRVGTIPPAQPPTDPEDPPGPEPKNPPPFPPG